MDKDSLPKHCFCKLPSTLKDIRGEHHQNSCDYFMLKLGGGMRIVRLDEHGQSVIEPAEDGE